MDIKRLAVPIIGAALVGGAVAGVGLTAFAASDSTTTTAPAGDHGPGGFGGGVQGTVTAVNGSTITVTSADGGTYTIDDSSASVQKYVDGAMTTVTGSGIAVGDTVMVNGSITTATMTAKDIRDGDFPKPTPPAATGKVTAVNGTTITLSGMAMPTTKGAKPTETTYTVDVSGATITKVAQPAAKGDKPTETTISASGIAVGDMLMVEGTVSGTSVTATKVTDGAGMSGFGGRGRGPAPAASGS